MMSIQTDSFKLTKEFKSRHAHTIIRMQIQNNDEKSLWLSAALDSVFSISQTFLSLVPSLVMFSSSIKILFNDLPLLLVRSAYIVSDVDICSLPLLSDAIQTT